MISKLLNGVLINYTYNMYISIFSDKVAVPVALGHYEDKIELAEKIIGAEKIDEGQVSQERGGNSSILSKAIALYGFNAARQQFEQHGRKNATRMVIMVTNGVNRYDCPSELRQ